MAPTRRAAPFLTPGAGPAALSPASSRQPPRAASRDHVLSHAFTSLAISPGLVRPHCHWSLRICGFLLAESRRGGGQSCACGGSSCAGLQRSASQPLRESCQRPEALASHVLPGLQERLAWKDMNDAAVIAESSGQVKRENVAFVFCFLVLFFFFPLRSV